MKQIKTNPQSKLFRANRFSGTAWMLLMFLSFSFIYCTQRTSSNINNSTCRDSLTVELPSGYKKNESESNDSTWSYFNNNRSVSWYRYYFYEFPGIKNYMKKYITTTTLLNTDTEFLFIDEEGGAVEYVLSSRKNNDMIYYNIKFMYCYPYLFMINYSAQVNEISLVKSEANKIIASAKL